MSLTKKDKEEIAKNVKSIVGKRLGPIDETDGVDHQLEMQAESWAEDGIKSELVGATIAPRDLYIVAPDGTTKTHFTYKEAEELVRQLPDGWRLPTRSEWALIAEEFGDDPETGELSSERLCSKLNLGLNGWQDLDNGSQYYVGSFGYFWSSTRYNNYYMYVLYVNTSSVSPASYDGRNYGYSVRCLLKATS